MAWGCSPVPRQAQTPLPENKYEDCKNKINVLSANFPLGSLTLFLSNYMSFQIWEMSSSFTEIPSGWNTDCSQKEKIKLGNFISKKKKMRKPIGVVCVCSPSYSGGCSRRITNLKLAWAIYGNLSENKKAIWAGAQKYSTHLACTRDRL